MKTNILCLIAVSLSVETVAQPTVAVKADLEENLSSSDTTNAHNVADHLTCGFVSGDPEDPVTCSPSFCAFLHVSGRENLYLGCCDDDQCDIQTTCIESGTALGRFTMACTDGSFSRCATWTWPDLSAVLYSCAYSRHTLTVATETSTSETLFWSTVVTMTAIPEEPTTPPDGVGSDDKHDADAAAPLFPSIGWEHGLDSRQRVGAGIGSGVIGGLLVIFFGIFGCWRGPARREPRLKTRRRDTVQSEVQLPGEKGAKKHSVTDVDAIEEA